MTVDAVDAAAGRVSLRMPMRPELERGGGKGQFHGGAIASLVDTAGDMAVAALVGGGAYYWNNSQKANRTANGGPILTVPTMAVAMGNVTSTVRVNGTVAAQNFAPLLAPRVMGSRSGMNRSSCSCLINLIRSTKSSE